MKPVWMSLAFLRIGWPGAIVGEARLQKPHTKHQQRSQNIMNGMMKKRGSGNMTIHYGNDGSIKKQIALRVMVA